MQYQDLHRATGIFHLHQLCSSIQTRIPSSNVGSCRLPIPATERVEYILAVFNARTAVVIVTEEGAHINPTTVHADLTTVESECVEAIRMFTEWKSTKHALRLLDARKAIERMVQGMQKLYASARLSKPEDTLLFISYELRGVQYLNRSLDTTMRHEWLNKIDNTQLN